MVDYYDGKPGQQITEKHRGIIEKEKMEQNQARSEAAAKDRLNVKRNDGPAERFVQNQNAAVTREEMQQKRAEARGRDRQQMQQAEQQREQKALDYYKRTR